MGHDHQRTERRLSRQELIDLGWVQRVNDQHRIGLWGPSARQHGTLPEARRMVELGLVRLVPQGSVDEMGYWITEAGRSVLSSPESAAGAT